MQDPFGLGLAPIKKHQCVINPLTPQATPHQADLSMDPLPLRPCGLAPLFLTSPTRQANLSHGGSGEVVTGRHPDAEAQAVRICTVLDMDIAGVDLLFSDEDGYLCCEVILHDVPLSHATVPRGAP